ncbi:BTB/POZ domain-containing protein KCTD7 [Patella vulgata]|uniref:BTB/POZ domain-containing protein KCTD7 n=1 Tax=Patella vulgata TaxID=6465 RepID=UPI00217FCC39|nr:BTB/POZ domain-containing protein KCTD7 [Patella vulgata]
MSDRTDRGVERRHKHHQKFPSVINLNVGGKVFATRLSTLTKYADSMLAVMFSGRHEVDKDAEGNYFIDRDGEYFGHILSFLRHEDLPPAEVAENVMKDAMFYGIHPLEDLLKSSPALFAEYVVRDNIRLKLSSYEDVKRKITALAKQQALDFSAISSVVKVVVSKNQPIPQDLQFSSKVHKQYFRRFKIYPSFESCFGKHYINIPADKVRGSPDDIMDLIASCLTNDLRKEGYRGHVKRESVYEEYNKIKTVSWTESEFHVCMCCHSFTFNWLETDIIGGKMKIGDSEK